MGRTRLLLVVLLVSAGLVGLGSSAGADTGGYPYANAVCSVTGRVDGQCSNLTWTINGNPADPWRYYYRNCTSYVAWKLHSRNGYTMPPGAGDAGNWDNYFRDRGVPVNNTPAVGAIAQRDGGTTGLGHVAYVEAVGAGTVRISEYNNPPYYGTYNTRTVPTNSFVYIHVKDVPPPPPPRAPSINGDEKADVAWYERWQNAITVLTSTGNGFAAGKWATGIGGPDWAGTGDFNGDRKTDIAWYERWQNAITVLTSTGSGFSPAKWITGIGGPDWAGTGDFNGDGKTDIAWYERWQNAITVLKSTGSGFSPAKWQTGIGGPTWAGTGDFTGDGRADIAWYEQWQNAITVLTSTGNGFATGKWQTGIGGPTWAGTGDFNGDRKADIAWYEQWQNAITVLKSTGSGFTTGKWITGIGAPDWAGTG